MIKLEHKQHGFHICYTEADAKACEKYGWVRCEIIKAKNLIQEVKEEVLIDETAVEVPRTKRKYTKKVNTDESTASD